jgi:formiminoglutamase
MDDFLQFYLAPDEKLWQGRDDSLSKERFFQVVNFLDLSEQSLLDCSNDKVMLGFCSDEGVKRNLGRPGAKLGPNALRHALAKLPIHNQLELTDIGNISCDDDNLEGAQKALGVLVDICHQSNKTSIVLGGGHEIAWGHYQGLSLHYKKLGIINFDAHFDLRPLQKDGKGSSGTPFYQIANHCHENERQFDYCCIGIQALANTRSLYQTADELNVSSMSAEQINQQSFAWQTAFLDDFILRQDAIYLTICLDVFAECFAPGVSAPQTMGLTPWQTLPLLKYVIQSGKVVSIDIAELSPPFDQGQKTSRLAANIVAELLY